MFICSYLKKSNKNLAIVDIKIVIYIIFLLFFNLLHTMNIIIKVIVSNNCIGNNPIFKSSLYITLNIPLYGIP